MNCEARRQLEAYIDGELSQPELEQMQVHLRGCSSCATEALGSMQLKRSIHATAAEKFVPSSEFRSRLMDSVQPRPRATRGLWPSLLVSAAMVVAVLVAALLLLQRGRRPDLAAEVIDLHVSTLASANPVDVVSTDRHTVKPWFQGKLPFTFNLPELQGSEFRLIGGRLAYIAGNPAAQLLFGIRKHDISVFILQDSERLARDFTNSGTITQLNFNLDTWSDSGLRYIVVTDGSLSDVQALSALLRSASQQPGSH